MKKKNQTYLTTEGLSERIHYEPRTIRTRLKDTVLLEGVHYFRPFGGRKILFIWESIEADMQNWSNIQGLAMPLSAENVRHG